MLQDNFLRGLDTEFALKLKQEHILKRITLLKVIYPVIGVVRYKQLY